MNNMMKQMQKLQKQMENLEEELKNQEVTASSGGGAVEATVNGKKELIRIKIDEAVVDPEDVGMLEDLVLTAVNSAMDEADNIANKRMGKLTGGLNILGL